MSKLWNFIKKFYLSILLLFMKIVPHSALHIGLS